MTKILLVDDNPPVRRLLSLTLASIADEVREAASGEEALACVRDWRPTLVVLDVMMPGNTDGLEVCRRIKADPELQHTLVLMLSARGQKTDIDAGIQAGADEYLVKPVSPMKLQLQAQKLLTAV